MTVSVARREYDAVVFDCDGVILDMNATKTAAFARVATNAGFDPEVSSRFGEWQAANFGLSRYRVFEALVAGRFGTVPKGCEASSLISAYAAIVEHAYLSAPECVGFRDLVRAIGVSPKYVVSGSDQTELRHVMRFRGLHEVFRDVLGSPTTKTENLRSVVLQLSPIHPSRVLFIGDALADADAARDCGTGAILVSRYSSAKDAISERAEAEGIDLVEDLVALASQTVRLPGEEAS